MHNGNDEILWGQTFKHTSYFNLRISQFRVLGPEILGKPHMSDWHAQGYFCFFTKRASICLEAPHVQLACSRQFCFRKNTPCNFPNPTRLTGVLKAVFFEKNKTAPAFPAVGTAISGELVVALALRNLFFCLHGPTSEHIAPNGPDSENIIRNGPYAEHSY